MTAPQSPAPAQSLLEEMGDALKYARRFLNPHDHDVAYIDAVLSRYRAAKAAEPDLVAAVKRLSEVSDQIWANLSDDEYRLMQAAWDQIDAALAAAQAKEGRDE